MTTVEQARAFVLSRRNLKEPLYFLTTMMQLVLDYHSIQKIKRGINMMEKHLKRIYNNTEKVSLYNIRQCREMEMIELATMREAVEKLTARQMKFTRYMKKNYTREEKFTLAQNPEVGQFACTLTRKEIEFVISVVPMMSTSPWIRKSISIRIYPHIFKYEKDVTIQTYDHTRNEYWHEEQACTLQILQLELKNGVRFRLLIWVDICGGSKELVYNHVISRNNYFTYTKNPAKIRLKFSVRDCKNLQFPKSTLFTHICTFTTAEKCASFIKAGKVIRRIIKVHDDMREAIKLDLKKLELKERLSIETRKMKNEMQDNLQQEVIANNNSLKLFEL